MHTLNVKTIEKHDFISSYIQNLLRGNGNELNAYLSKVDIDKKINKTQSITRCYMINSDAQHMPRVEDLALKTAFCLLDYAIPRSEIERAKFLDIDENTTANTMQLKRKAKKLFTRLEKTGEGGELLLYLLIQNVLKLPQAISKMSLKTSSQLHYQGADAIHIGYDERSQKLLLYWGEAKMIKSIDRGINDCFESLSPYLTGEKGANDPRERDLQLLMTNLDMANPSLEKALLKYLDPNDPAFNSLEYRGACLIGFDTDIYCSEPFSKIQEIVYKEINTAMDKWISKIDKGINKYDHLNKFTLDIFIIPFPSVQKFRDSFLEAIKDV